VIADVEAGVVVARAGVVVWTDIDDFKPFNDQHRHRLDDLRITVVTRISARVTAYTSAW
jgi:GGDEF domain-containing protein